MKQGGIFPIGQNEPYRAVLIKVNLSEGKYKNAWLVENTELKFYLKSIKTSFDKTYSDNLAIWKHKDTPIYAFIRNGADFTLEGIFHCSEIITEPDNSKWFYLVRGRSSGGEVVTNESYRIQLDREVARSLSLSGDARRVRLTDAPSKPKRIATLSGAFLRNPDVIAEVLLRANGQCEKCDKPAPFIRSSNRLPYLEVHHKVWLSMNGDDTVENAIAICPNCHREFHFG